MADQTEQMNRLLKEQTGAAIAPDEMEMSYTVDGKAVSMKPSEMDAARASGEIQMINNAQEISWIMIIILIIFLALITRKSLSKP